LGVPSQRLTTSENAISNSNFEHIFMEFQRIDLLIHSYIRKLKAELQDGLGDYQGLFITETEINYILKNSLFESEINSHSSLEIEEIKTLTHKINRKKITV